MKGLAFLFPGQGAQFVGMGKELYDEFPVVRETFAEANEVLGFDLTRLCFEGPLEELTKTENTQPAIVTCSIAHYRAFMEVVGLTPEYVAGHSLGEYSALVSAGALSFADALQLVRLRGKYMQEAVPVGVGAMKAVMNLAKDRVTEVCRSVSTETEIVVPANYNSEKQIVISGHAEAVERAGKQLEAMGGLVQALKVSAPFHSPLMQSASEKMKEELQKYEFGPMHWPVISNVRALPYKYTHNLRENLTVQITEQVNWHDSMDYLAMHNITKAVELGPQKVLKNLLNRSFPQIEVFNFKNKSELELINAALATKNLNLVLSKSLAVAVATRNQNFDTAEYEKGVVEPYNQIKNLQLELENKGVEPTVEQATMVLENLKLILTTKRVPISEQVERINSVLDYSGTRHLFANFALPGC